MDDIVRSLRGHANYKEGTPALLRLAADEIERLRAALERIVNWKTDKEHWEDIARAVLENEKR